MARNNFFGRIRARTGNGTGVTITGKLHSDIADKVARYVSVREKYAEFEKQKKELSSQIKSAIGSSKEHSIIYTGEYYDVSIGVMHSTSIDVEQLKKDHPDIFEKYSSNNVTRRLYVNKKKV